MRQWRANRVQGACSAASESPGAIDEHVLGAVRGLVRDVLDTSRAPRLLELLPSLRAWIMAIIRGA